MHIPGGAAANADSFLPMSATCMNILKLPAYSDIGSFARQRLKMTTRRPNLCLMLRVSAFNISPLVAETMRTKLVYAMNSNSGFFLA